MNKYNNLLMRISEEYAITSGASEETIQWKTRLIYSVLGRMALASLFDMAEENISVTHMKRRIETLLSDYKEMYPELSRFLPYDAEELSNEMYDIYLHTGTIYHEPNRVVLAMKSEAIFERIRFTRGFEIESRQMMSGLGTYQKADHVGDGYVLAAMYQLEKVPLAERWNQCIKSAAWKDFNTDINVEYLRMEPPFKRGYWVDKPDSSGRASLLRTGFKGSQIYYLYKMDHEKIKASQLPIWQVEGYNYRSLACACLSSENVLQPTSYHFDGDLVYINFGYLPPPAELYLWKLYSWPATMATLPRDFNRICTRPVFEAIKTVMLQQGYEFTEER